MSATVEKLSIPRRFRAWCDECSDGYQGGKIAANNWAYLHNENRHGSEETP
jgi:hypothetical protein